MAHLMAFTNLLLQSVENMRLSSFTWLASANLALSSTVLTPPYCAVPACPAKATITYNKSAPDLANFPSTLVELCYNKSHIEINFVAHAESAFFFNSSFHDNDAIWKYEVMEAFIAPGLDDPTRYFEFEVAPNNVTLNAFIYNPSKVREDGAPMETYFIADPKAAGISSRTFLEKRKQVWMSSAKIPLHLFIEKGDPIKGSKWRMNFFRTVTSPDMFPKQLYGAWSPPNKTNFHMTPFFGAVEFI